MNRADFQKLTKLRLKEAKLLLDNKCYEGAFYLAGYAVECALKACIAKKTKRFEFPPHHRVVSQYYQHDPLILVNKAGLELDLNEQAKLVPGFENFWKAVAGWKEDARYETKIDRNRANDLYIAITAEPNGVLSWLKKYW